jgi:hypothetical protein
LQPDGRCLRHDGCPPYLGRTRGGQGAGPELRPRARCLLNAVVAKVFQVALHASEASGMLSVLSRVFLDIDGVVVGSGPAEQRLRGSRIEVAEGFGFRAKSMHWRRLSSGSHYCFPLSGHVWIFWAVSHRLLASLPKTRLRRCGHVENRFPHKTKELKHICGRKKTLLR